ncbi:hypothetical protein C8Q76DRAFT_175428 [Earliella scabrosa]|nr:hypothetical protein C8Q76DRAFT_175428 [Earliella scabrosa]
MAPISDTSTSTITAQDSKIAPFRNSAVGDTIIQTKDGVTFHVYKCVLVIASAYFGAKWPTLRIPTAHSDAPKSIMRVDEDSDVWEKLLPLIYASLAEPIPTSDVSPLALAARKYQMTGVTALLSRVLLRADVMEEPLRVYALACVRVRLLRCCPHRCTAFAPSPSPVEFVDELRYASAAAYHRLSDYRRRCTEAVRALPTWVVLPPLWMMGDGAVRSLLRGSSTATGMIVLIPAAQLTRREASRENVATYTHSAWREATERLGKVVDERVDIILLPLLPISSTHSYARHLRSSGIS